jgi:hypothetical protein
MQGRRLLKSREMRSLIVVFGILSLLLVPVRGAFAVNKIQPMNYATFTKTEDQTTILTGLMAGGLMIISNVSHNTLTAYSYGYAGVYSFSSDDWCCIVTTSTPSGCTDHYSAGNMTQYYDPSSGQTTNITNRQTYQVLMSPDWILLGASTANIIVNCAAGGHVSGSVIGRFSPPDGFSPLGSTFFNKLTTISF